MMKKLTYLLLLVSFQFYGQGLKLTPKEELKTFTKLPADKYGFATILPFASSLEKYVPPVRTQEGGTCVGFASFIMDSLQCIMNVLTSRKMMKNIFILLTPILFIQ